MAAEEVIEWLEEYLPRFVDLIAARRCGVFVAGMRESYEKEVF
jgi:hypothetical protein